ncbi:uncharacterized protein LOC143585318 [Bidens hawaiensis]|uniref:uncharacterized protein LOC143585318 n=1 Tax=Bidens hawaiensis TaxID=980011 RepID=UPI0040493E3F
MQHCSIVHGAPYDSISAVRWNPSNQHEIAYTRLANGELTIFDIEHSQAIQVLRTRPAASDHEGQGLSDIAFLNSDTRVLASDASGAISMWDRRASDLPQRVLKTNKNIGLTSIQLYGDQRVYGASKDGFIYVWDLGGASQSDKEVNSSPQISINLDSMLNEHQPLEAQINIRPKVIQSININPSCPYQLGFHTDDGWSGVLNMHNYLVSHVHCPPPPRV